MTAFSLDVAYGQIAAFDATLVSPFSDWTEVHVRQGFAWRPGSVSFATLEAAGAIAVAVDETAAPAVSNADRVIVVPFTVPAHGAIEVATIVSSVPLRLTPGERELTFAHGRRDDGALWATFRFRPVATPVAPRVLRADPGLSPPDDLVMTASPA